MDETTLRRGDDELAPAAAQVRDLMRGRQVVFFDHAADPDFVRDPITPLLRMLEEQGSVVRGRANRFGDVVVSNHFLLPDDQDSYLILGFAANQQVMSDISFSSELGYASSYGQSQGRALHTIDEPDHMYYRKLVSKPFTARQVHTLWLDRHIKPIIDARIDEFADKGSGDLLSELAIPFPYQVIASIVGVPQELELPLAQYVNDMLAISENPERALAALGQVNDIMIEVIREHRRRPQDDLIGALIESEVDGVRLEDNEIAMFIGQMIAAGLDTTYRGTGTLLWALMEHPDQLERLEADRSLVAGAVEEALRVAPPAGAAPRVATRDVVVDGVTIPAGSPVLLALSSANHDPSVFDEPLKFDIERKPNRHLTFGVGAHVCLGLHLAREEMQYALNATLDKLPNLRKDDVEWEGAELNGWAFRSPTKLPVAWDAEPKTR